MNTVLITGANRGLGLEFCRQYANEGWQVIACCRHPAQAMQLNSIAGRHSRLQVFEMDVTNHDEIDELADKLSACPVDVLIANAGIYGDSGRSGFGNLDYAAWRETLETNVLGVVKVAEAFASHLRRGNKPLIVALSSLMGSIADNNSGGSILYRSSKAALNSAMKTLAIDLESFGIGVLVFHPGWVRTDMGGPNALIDAATSVSGMVQQIRQFKLSKTGVFLKYDGTPLPW